MQFIVSPSQSTSTHGTAVNLKAHHPLRSSDLLYGGSHSNTKPDLHLQTGLKCHMVATQVSWTHTQSPPGRLHDAVKKLLICENRLTGRQMEEQMDK